MAVLSATLVFEDVGFGSAECQYPLSPEECHGSKLHGSTLAFYAWRRSQVGSSSSHLEVELSSNGIAAGQLSPTNLKSESNLFFQFPVF